MNTKYIITLLSLSVFLMTSTNLAFAQSATSTAYPRMKNNLKIRPDKNLHAASDAVNKTIDQLSQLAMKLQTKISSASAADNDVTTLTPLLTDMQNKIEDAKQQSIIVDNTINNPGHSTFDASSSSAQTSFKNSRKLFSIARNDLKIAIQDAMKIIMALKSFKTRATPTPSV